MSETKTSGINVNIGLGGALFILFLTLRLTDVIDWAWYWIAAPLWIPLALGLLIVLIALVAMYFIERSSSSRVQKTKSKPLFNEDDGLS